MTSLQALYEQHQGKVSDKWSLYLSEYDRLLAEYREQPVRLLEIGVQNGGSLEIWSRYFINARKIVGCDIDPECGRLRYADQRVAVVVGDANSHATEGLIASICPAFDLIVDDGSHRSGDIVRSFVRYFARLADDGLYIVEDIHCSYWAHFKGGLHDPASSMAFFRRLTDVINHEHWGIPALRRSVLDLFAREYDVDIDEAQLRHIHSIEFVNSFCVIRKRAPAANLLGERIVAGNDDAVVRRSAGLLGSPHPPAADETDNPWSSPSQLPETVIANARADLEVLQAQYLQTCRELELRTAQGASLAVERDHLLEDRRAKESLVTQLDAELRSARREKEAQDSLVAQLKSALWSALRAGSALANDKWWRRTSLLRNWSNSLRKLKGKPLKTWPVDFSPETYLRAAASGKRSERSATQDPGRTQHSRIPQVEYTEISEDFVPLSQHKPIETVPRAIAFYLPQFHPFEENDAWWGKGFTEWTNVGKARPLFEGHYQPHCPIHLGYYDLRVRTVMEEQAALARSYGISGFAYYFYWFAGKVLMEDPLKQMLANPKVDISFCMIWANENWTRRWDGKEHDVLIAQKHSTEDSRAILDYLRPFFDDPRYIRVNGKPLFIIYRADIIPDLRETLKLWRDQAASFGHSGLYIVCAQTFGQRDPRTFGFDAAMQFPPHTVHSNSIIEDIDGLEPGFSGEIYDYDQAVTNAVQHRNEDYKVLPTAMLSWDTTARKGMNGIVFDRFSVIRFAQWLSSNAEFVAKNTKLSLDEKLIFVNAWNEWAEGTHLEPDQKYGYGYLAATRSVMNNYASAGVRFLDPTYPKTACAAIAVVVHVHYEHTWPDLRVAISRLQIRSPDLYVTVTSLRLAETVLHDFPGAVVELVDNRGRDIRPFLHVLKKIAALGYTAVCKVHGKASSYRSDGDELRRSALDSLVDEANIGRFEEDAALGLLVPAGFLIEHTEKNLTYSGALTEALAEEIGLAQWRGSFPAGSMFWFRPEAFAPLTRLGADDFDIERGLVDGTRANAIERLFCAVCRSAGYRVETTQKPESAIWRP